jgi:uncharacterized protein (TIGR02302 family)
VRVTLDPLSDTSRSDTTSAAALQHLDRLAKRASLTLIWEQAWPRIVALLCLGGLFVTVSWLGLWLALPSMGRIAGLVLFGIVTLGLLVRAATVRRPVRREALARLDRDSGLRHAPASGLVDALANAGDDPATRALWQLHRRRLFAATQKLQLALPSPRLAERDRYALRAGILVVLVASSFIAGPERYIRIAAAFDWRGEMALAKGFRLDAWIDPPAYTGKPPILLPAHVEATLEPGHDIVATKVRAPVNSTLVVRSAGNADINVQVEGGLVVPEAPKDKKVDSNAAATTAVAAPAEPAKDATQEHRWTLKGDAKLSLRRGDRLIAAFSIASIPDRPPTISLTEPPQTNARGSLTLSYQVDDDYGVTSAEATFSNPELHGRSIVGHTLVDPPKIPLTLPPTLGARGRAQTIADLSDSPWGGAHVSMTLAAHDDGGNIGKSEPIDVTLPQRPFSKPIARALAEQRRNLVLAPDERARVAAALDGLLIAPEVFTPQSSIYLGLFTANARLQRAKTDDDLRDVADYLWQMALQIEDGSLSDAERQLRAAEEKLREAMQRGASEEEMHKLTQELRNALDKFLNEMAQRQQRDQKGQNSARDSKTITPKDLQSMLDRMDEMARSGDMASAQEMLDQLQSMLENLQNAENDDGSDEMSRQMDQALNDLDKMTREQQQLRDDTFREGHQGKHQQQAQPNDPGSQDQAEDGNQGDDQDAQEAPDTESNHGLQQRQNALQKRLQELRRKMKQFGMKDEKGLEDAESAMGEADKDLGKNQNGRAVDAQGRALEALRRGAQGMAQQMEEQGNQSGQAQGGPGDDGRGNRRGNRQSRRDPLDRPSRFDDYFRSGQLNVGPGAAQRAQQVLEELRRRLSDPNRPREELDYLDRLLRRY